MEILYYVLGYCAIGLIFVIVSAYDVKKNAGPMQKLQIENSNLYLYIFCLWPVILTGMIMDTIAEIIQKQ